MLFLFSAVFLLEVYPIVSAQLLLLPLALEYMLGPIKPLYATARTPGAKSQRGSVMEVIAEQGVTFG